MSPGSRSTTGFFEFARAALDLEFSRVSQSAKERSVAIDRGQFLLAYVAGRNGKKAARKNFPSVRNEDKSLAIIETAQCAPYRVI
jgi:hypothetical protein